MDRRTFIVGFLIAPLVAQAQQSGRLGYLAGWSSQAHNDELERALGRLGWVQGQNLAIEYRWAEGKYERYPTLAGELARLKVDVIVAPTTSSVLAVQRATSSIPIVMVFVAEPVGLGLVQSFARPAGTSPARRCGAAGRYSPSSCTSSKRLRLGCPAWPSSGTRLITPPTTSY